MRCALYFGSFNPLHIGHAAIARYVLENCNVDTLRLVLTPMNPFKEADPTLANVELRLENLRKSVDKFNRNSENCSSEDCNSGNCSSENRSRKKLEISTVEFDLPKPNYTYNTLQHLKAIEPDNTFIIIMGADNLAVIEKWHKGLEILSTYEVWVYPRQGFDTKALCKKYGATYLDAPQIDVSSTMIREGESKGLDMSHLRY
jgi:nicotinate-nucleotide adenylyltransferase